MPRRVAPAVIPTAGTRLAGELDRLAAVDGPDLERRWRQVFGRATPPGLSPALLHQALAYRIQALALGDLDRETIRALERLGQDGRGQGASVEAGGRRRAGGQGGRTLPLPDLRGRLPGTLLSREWQGRMHAVMVLETGFAWNGATYDSLSKVARAITGTQWNGPRFFGLRKGRVQAERQP